MAPKPNTIPSLSDLLIAASQREYQYQRLLATIYNNYRYAAADGDFKAGCMCREIEALAEKLDNDLLNQLAIHDYEPKRER